MELSVKAVGHRVIVKPDLVETKSKGGLILAVNEKREQAAAQRGTVMDVGEMAWKNTAYGFGLPGWSPWCKTGDRVFFARYAGKGFKDGDSYFVVLNDEDIQCQIVKETVEAENVDDTSN